MYFSGTFLLGSYCQLRVPPEINFKGYDALSGRGNSVKIILRPSENGATLNCKNLLPKGTHSFVRQNPFLERTWFARQQTRSYKICLSYTVAERKSTILF